MRVNSEAPATPRPGTGRLLAGLVLFGAAFGFVEAAVVIDLRAIYEPLQRQVYPETLPGELFPLLSPENLAAGSRKVQGLMKIEVAREACTILMLAGVGLCAGGTGVRGFAAFLVAFGVWDVAYYAALKLLIDWPASVWTWDLLFLIPVPWVAPVLAPVVVAATMVACGAHAIARDFSGSPVRASRWGWLAVVAGGAVVVGSFCRDFPDVMSGGVPARFDWVIFAAGEGVAVAGYLASACRREPGRGEPAPPR